MFGSQKSEFWTSWIQITYLSCFAYRIILRLGKFWIRLVIEGDPSYAVVLTEFAFVVLWCVTANVMPVCGEWA
jgi:hypothetical protein